MLFSVGYATKAENQLVQEIIALKDGINEVYFSWGKTPSGRNDQTRSEGLTPWEAQAKQIEDLKTLHKAGLKFNLLFNANCYGEKAQARSFFEEVGETVEYIGGNFTLSSVILLQSISTVLPFVVGRAIELVISISKKKDC